jgi:elongation factor Tu
MTASTQNKPPEQQFRMRIEEVRSIPGRGTLVTGPIEQGAVAAGDGVEIVGSGAKPIASVVTAVFVSGKVSGRGHAGDTVGVLLRAVDPNQVTRGQVLRAS